MKRYSFIAIIFALLGVAYTTAHNKSAGIPFAVYDIVYSDTTSTSQADSLALAQAEMLAMMMMADSLNTAAPDTTVAVADSMSVAKVDSVAVDSASLKPAIPDSLIVGYMPERTSWKYFSVKQRSADDVIKLKNLYKKKMEQDRISGTLNAYDVWKVAFKSTENRSLDMYMDGIKMLMSKVYADTMAHRYDRFAEHRDELMELYDLAIYNLEALNAQLDTAKNKDTLSVAKLRGQQLRYYRDITLMDSIFNGDSLNRFVSRDTLMEKINENMTHARFLYPRYKEIATSTDMNIDLADIAHFANQAYLKFFRDREIGLGQAVRKNNVFADSQLIAKRRDELMLSIENPNSILYKDDIYSGNATVKDWYDKQNRPIEEVLLNIGILFPTNPCAVIEIYQKKWDDALMNNDRESFDKVVEEIVTYFAKNKLSEFDGCIGLYKKALLEYRRLKPSYELEDRIANVSFYMKDMSEGLTAINNMIDKFKSDFKKKPIEEQANTYMLYVALCTDVEKGGRPKNLTKRLEYIKVVKEICPEHPDAYYYGARILLEEVKLKSGGYKKIAEIVKDENGLSYKDYEYYSAVCDRFIEARNKYDALKNNPETKIKARGKEESYNYYIEQYCPTFFVTVEENFMSKIAGKEVVVDFGKYGGKQKTKIKLQK